MSLPVRPEDTPAPRRRNLNTARFSDEPDDEVIVPAPRHWYHNRWLLALVILVALVVLWKLMEAFIVVKFCAILLGLFWFFAIGIHPMYAAARTIGSWFGDDD